MLRLSAGHGGVRGSLPLRAPVMSACYVLLLERVSSLERGSVIKTGISGLGSTGRALGALLVGAVAITLPWAGNAQDESPRRDEKPRTQQDILKESERACAGLKGEARSECMANYVGPVRDKPAGSWKRPPNPPRPSGRE